MKSKFLLRIDDFPHGGTLDPRLPEALEGYPEIHAILQKFNVPYILAVVPKLLTKSHYDYLNKLTGVIIAQHGYDHSQGFMTSGYDNIREKIFEGKRLLEKHDPKIYVPPHNRVTYELFDILVDCGFKVVTGGPGGDDFVKDIDNIRRERNIIYAPTSSLFYGNSGRIIKDIDRTTHEIECISLHWTWEYNLGNTKNMVLNNFIESIKDRIIGWDKILCK